MFEGQPSHGSFYGLLRPCHPPEKAVLNIGALFKKAFVHLMRVSTLLVCLNGWFSSSNKTQEPSSTSMAICEPSLGLRLQALVEAVRKSFNV